MCLLTANGKGSNGFFITFNRRNLSPAAPPPLPSPQKNNDNKKNKKTQE